MKVLKPIIKRKKGKVSTFCKKCRAVIQENLTELQLKKFIGIAYCPKCAKEELEKFMTNFSKKSAKKKKQTKKE